MTENRCPVCHTLWNSVELFIEHLDQEIKRHQDLSDAAYEALADFEAAK